MIENNDQGLMDGRTRNHTELQERMLAKMMVSVYAYILVSALQCDNYTQRSANIFKYQNSPLWGYW